MFILGLGKKKKPGLGGKWPLKVEGSVYAWATRRKKKKKEGAGKIRLKAAD